MSYYSPKSRGRYISNAAAKRYIIEGFLRDEDNCVFAAKIMSDMRKGWHGQQFWLDFFGQNYHLNPYSIEDGFSFGMINGSVFTGKFLLKSVFLPTGAYQDSDSSGWAGLTRWFKQNTDIEFSFKGGTQGSDGHVVLGSDTEFNRHWVEGGEDKAETVIVPSGTRFELECGYTSYPKTFMNLWGGIPTARIPYGVDAMMLVAPETGLDVGL